MNDEIMQDLMQDAQEVVVDTTDTWNEAIDKVLEIIDRNSSVISDKTALKWIRAEVQALQEEQG